MKEEECTGECDLAFAILGIFVMAISIIVGIIVWIVIK